MIKDFLIAIGNYKGFGKLVKNKGRRVTGYVALLLIVCSIGTAAIPTIKIINALGTFFMQELPDFTISNEGFEITEDFEFELSGVKVLMTDEREVTSEDFGENVLSGALFDTNSVIIRNMDETAEFSYGEFAEENEKFKFSKSDLNLLKPFMNVFKFLMVAASTIAFVLSYILNGLFIGLISKLIGSMLHVKKPFSKHLKAALYAKTLPTVLGAILNPFGILLPMFSGTVYSLVIIYLYLKGERGGDMPPEIV